MKNFLLIIFICSCSSAFSQVVRLHLMGGCANYTGDIQQKRFTLSQANAVVSAGATINITDKLALRGDLSFTKLGADDKKNSKLVLFRRNLNFKTNIYEAVLLGEYNLFNLNERSFTPYAFGGVGVFHFSPYTYDSKGNKAWLADLSTEGQGFLPGKKVYKTTQLNIPIGGGFKYALSQDVHVGFEFGLRVLKTDYLDDVSTTYVDRNVLLVQKGQQAVDVAFRGDELKDNPGSYPPGGTIRGSAKSNDFYYFLQFRLSFLLPWFNGNERAFYRTSRKSLSCPSRF